MIVAKNAVTFFGASLSPFVLFGVRAKTARGRVGVTLNNAFCRLWSVIYSVNTKGTTIIIIITTTTTTSLLLLIW